MDATDFLTNMPVNEISTKLHKLELGDYFWIYEDNPKRLWAYRAGSSRGDYIRVFMALSPAALSWSTYSVHRLATSFFGGTGAKDVVRTDNARPFRQT